jgi:UDPglucose--hexose-1-phosphate uridylyltransferase
VADAAAHPKATVSGAVTHQSSAAPARPRRPAGGARRSTVFSQSHRRYNPLIDEWVLVSPERTNRPWLGRRDPRPPADLPAYDPKCYLCPGNTRANGDTNPEYSDTFVFTNDFAALQPDSSMERIDDGLLRAEGEQGTCRVLCFSPRHNLTMAGMSSAGVRRIIDVWAEQTADLGQRFRWVQLFENRGETMGASNPHPHGQLWAGSALPREAAREDASQRSWWDATGRRLLLDYADQESVGPRVIHEDVEWLVVVPFWALWPYETLVVAKRPVERLTDLDEGQRDSLAASLIDLLSRYDNLFELPFPYSMGWHQAPFDGDSHAHWQLHAHFYPPLLRSATVRKFVVGYELLAENQRDLTPEEAAARLRQTSPVQRLGDAVGRPT